MSELTEQHQLINRLEKIMLAALQLAIINPQDADMWLTVALHTMEKMDELR